MQHRKGLFLTGACVVVLSAFSSAVFAECCLGSCTCSTTPVEKTYSRGRWFVLETTSFQVCCEGSADPAIHLARNAEDLRSKLTSTWLGSASSASAWHPKCQIVLYSNKASYVSAVGRGSERTVGSSLVKTEKNKIVSRRIDLLGGGENYLTASLPHELTHVILKDRFPSAHLPRWADEGTAMLADPAAKQSRHRKDLEEGLGRGATFHAAALLELDGYPPAHRWGVFYGQSASLVKFLVQRNSPEHFVKFIEKSTSQGYDASLQDCYGIENVAALDRVWRLHVTQSTSSLTTLPASWSKSSN